MPTPSWRLPGVWVGFVGSAVLGLGSCSNGYSFNPAGWGVGPIAGLAAWISLASANLLSMTGIVVLSIGWFLLTPRTGLTAPRGLWLLWIAPLLVVPPVASGDPFLYADIGWIVANGGNPYVDVLGSYGGPFDPFVDRFWAGNGVAYPPLTLVVNWLAAELGGMHPYWGVVAQRVPAVVGLALAVSFLPRLADELGVDRNWAVWLGALNPVMISHLIGGAHNDSLMVGMVVFAIWLSLRRVPWVSASLVLAPIVIGIAMALKQQAGLAVIAAAGLPVAARLAGLPWLRRVAVLGWRTAVATLVAVGTFAAVSLATGFGFGWIGWLGQMGRARTMTASVAIGDALAWTGHDYTGLANAVFAIAAVAGLAALLLLRPERPMLATAWGALFTLLIGQSLHPWYFGLSLALLALVPLGRKSARWVVFGCFGYLYAYSVTHYYGFSVVESYLGGAVAGGLALATWLGGAHRTTRLG